MTTHAVNDDESGPSGEASAQTNNRRPVRSFVRREGRITKGQQRALDSLLPRFGVDDLAAPLDPDDVFGRTAPLTLEIGFGNGSSLAEMAVADPGNNFLGVEVYRPGVGKLLLEIEKQELQNVRVSLLDANEVIQSRLSPASVDRILILFPDPWPKKKHLKRRLIQSEFVDLMTTRLKAGGVIHVATDIESYAEHTQEILDGCSKLENTAASGGYVSRPSYRPVTKYERRGTRLGHSVFDLVYRLV